MNILIRPEEVSDYNQIANLTYAAFVEQKDNPFRPDPLVTAVLRNNPRFDADLCFVAMDGVRVVGYALFAPFEFIVLGERRKGVYLAPLCVAPGYRGAGIGAKLLAIGRRTAREKGCALSLLYGPQDYFGRHGYLPRMYALSGARAHVKRASIAIEGLEEADVTEGDLAFVVGMWRAVHGGDRLAWYPGDTISQWFGHTAANRASVFRHGGRAVGYVKRRIAPPHHVSEFLVEADYAPAVLEWLRQEAFGAEEGTFEFSATPPALRSAFQGCGWVAVTPALRADDSMMLLPLDERDAILKTYLELARQNDQNLGIPVFPAPLDMD